MTTFQFILLRLYMVTVGRMGFFAGVLREILVRRLIRTRRGNPYSASSRFFSRDELD